MKYIALSGFSTMRAGNRVVVEKGSVVEMNDKTLIDECMKKKLIEKCEDEEVEHFDEYDIKQDNEDFDEYDIEQDNEDFDEDDVVQNNVDFDENHVEQVDETLKVVESKENSEKVVYYTSEQIKKLKTKADVVAYGQSIGLDELNDNFSRDELDEMVIEYIENLEVENEDV